MAEVIHFLQVKKVTKLFSGEKISGIKEVLLEIIEVKITAIINFPDVL